MKRREYERSVSLHVSYVRGLNESGKSKRIKTRQCGFYTRIKKNMSCKSRAPRTQSGTHNEYQPNILRALYYVTIAFSIHRKPGYRSQSTYQVHPETNLDFKFLLTLYMAAVPSQSLM
ncbi:hypothetical protein M9H77_18666 [Catharanthus roseus]|uniref:Uncharacterized protein n=1 Tax=Catharanthus roseus TaxID=4058 RepID=A0ACC0B8D3_CATRO|nr:hypothetical protein M9H77_18666 [Catharanthus roseus]